MPLTAVGGRLPEPAVGLFNLYSVSSPVQGGIYTRNILGKREKYMYTKHIPCKGGMYTIHISRKKGVVYHIHIPGKKIYNFCWFN